MCTLSIGRPLAAWYASHYMTDAPHPPTKPTRATTGTLLVTLADTTWRMLVPSALLVAVGIFADIHWQTKPWLTLSGVLLGLLVSGGLIYHQLGRVR